jgi:uncharacterized protein
LCGGALPTLHERECARSLWRSASRSGESPDRILTILEPQPLRPKSHRFVVKTSSFFEGSELSVTLLWALVVLLMVVGVAGTVLPALPGVVLVLAGAVLGAWIDDFTRIGVATVVVLSLLAVLAWVLDYVAGLLGARRAGASKQALVGAAVGTVVGLFMGLIGVFFMPLVGAAIGEYLARRDEKNALKVGVATWLGIMAGLLAKVVIVFTMIGIFVVALWW